MPNAMNHGRAQPTAAYRVLLLVSLAVPLIISPSLIFFDITPKWLALLAGSALLWLVSAAENRFPKLGGDMLTWLVVIGVLTVSLILSTALSVDPVMSLLGNEWRRMGLTSWLAVLAIVAAIPLAVGEVRGRRREFLAAIVLAAVGASLYIFLQYGGYDPLIDSALYRVGESGNSFLRPPSTFGHANSFAAFALLAAFAAAGLARTAISWRGRTLWSGSAVLLVLALLVSGSRASWLGLGVGAGLFALRTSDRLKILKAFLAVALVLAGFVLSPLGRGVRNRLYSFSEEPGTATRMLIWRDSLALILSHPLLGTGPDTYAVTFPAHQSGELAQSAPDQVVESPHNIVLDLAADCGLPAVILFGLLFQLSLRRLSARSRTSPLDAALYSGLVAALLMAQFNGNTISTVLALLTVAALALAGEATQVPQLMRVSVGLTATLFLGLVAWFGIGVVQAEQLSLQAKRALGSNLLDQGLSVGKAIPQAYPWTGTYVFLYSRELGEVLANSAFPLSKRPEFLTLAEQTAQAGLRHATQPQMVYVHLASILVLQGRHREAETALREAIRAAPAWYRPHWLLAVLLSGREQWQDSAREAETALALGARLHPEIVASINKIRHAWLDSESSLLETDKFQGLPRSSLSSCGGNTLLPSGEFARKQVQTILTPGPTGNWDGVSVRNGTIVSSKGELLLFYSGFDGKVWRTGVAHSRDSIHWAKAPQPVLAPSETGWDSSFMAANGTASILDGNFFYWYQGGTPSRIGLAFSADGQVWSKHPDPVLEAGTSGGWEALSVSEPSVVHCGKTLLLYYTGIDSSGIERLGVAASRDGIHWNKYPGNPILTLGKAEDFDGHGVSHAAVYPISGGFAMFYAGRDARERIRMGMAYSSDGVIWVKRNGLNPLPLGNELILAQAPSFAYTAGSQFHMVFNEEITKNSGESSRSEIKMATEAAQQGISLLYTQAKVSPSQLRERKDDTPNQMWAFPYRGSSMVTLAQSSLTFLLDVPPNSRFLTRVRMPLPNADPTNAIVRVNGQQLIVTPGAHGNDIDLDLGHFAGAGVELTLAATPGPLGQRAAWVEWENPRVVSQRSRQTASGGYRPLGKLQ